MKKMDEQERAEYEADGKKERERHVKNAGQQLIEELQYILGPNLKNIKICSSAVWSIFLRNGGVGSTRMTTQSCMQ